VHPTLLQLDGGAELGLLPLSAYPTMVAVGFGFAILLFCRGGARRGLRGDILFDLGLYMVIFGVLGARLLHVLADGQFWNYVHWCTQPDAVFWNITPEHCRALDLETRWDEAAGVCRPVNAAAEPVWHRCTLWLQFWQGGLAFYGGFLMATGFAFYFLRREGLPLKPVLDLAGWTIPLGLAWGRMGCFLNGCCFGRVAHDSWTATAFPRWSPAWQDQVQAGVLQGTADLSLHVHPTQLYEAAAALAIAAVAYGVVEPRKSFSGQVFLVSCVLYGVARFAVEFWRADERGLWWGVSTSQWIGVIIVALALWAWPRFRRASRGGRPARNGAGALPATKEHDVAHRR
jgi:phosphatidylglycerol:prolipoprotein diacylglycerol transferase